MAGPVTELDDSGDVVGSHSYSVAGFHSVVLAVLDDDGDVGASAAVTIIVFDPVSLWIDGEAEFELRVSNEDFEAAVRLVRGDRHDGVPDR